MYSVRKQLLTNIKKGDFFKPQVCISDTSWNIEILDYDKSIFPHHNSWLQVKAGVAPGPTSSYGLSDTETEC